MTGAAVAISTPTYSQSGRVEPAPLHVFRAPSHTPLPALTYQTNNVPLWAKLGASVGTVEPLEDDLGYWATVDGAEGIWGMGSTSEEALADLEKSLEEWASLKSNSGQRDFPSFGGVELILGE